MDMDNSEHDESVSVPSGFPRYTNGHEVAKDPPKRSISSQTVQTTEPAEDVAMSQNTTAIVKPVKAGEEKWIPLSVLDKFILPIYIPVYFIYDSIPEESFHEFVEGLQRSLAQVLEYYYPFAGKLKKNQASQSWEVHCDNSGVEFSVVYSNEKLKHTKFCKPSLELRLLAPRIDAVPTDDTDSLPTLSVQVTKFKCGAVALGCNFHHQSGDAYAVSLFMQAWSQLTRDKPLSIHPVHDRSKFVPETVTGSKEPPPPAIVGTKAAVKPSDSVVESMVKRSYVPMPSVEEDFADGELEGLVFETEELNKLKNMSPGSTSFEATTAFILRHVHKAYTRLHPEEEDVAKFVMMVDFRSKFSASEFVGNFALPKAVILPRQQFIGGSLSDSVKPIHTAIKGADEAYFRAFVQYAGRGPPSKERAMAVSSCARVPLYDVDFGYGAPCFAGINPPVPRLVPEFLLFLPNVNKEGFVAYLQLEKDILQHVLEDAEFNSIAKKYRPLDHYLSKF